MRRGTSAESARVAGTGVGECDRTGVGAGSPREGSQCRFDLIRSLAAGLGGRAACPRANCSATLRSDGRRATTGRHRGVGAVPPMPAKASTKTRDWLSTLREEQQPPRAAAASTSQVEGTDVVGTMADDPVGPPGRTSERNMRPCRRGVVGLDRSELPSLSQRRGEGLGTGCRDGGEEACSRFRRGVRTVVVSEQRKPTPAARCVNRSRRRSCEFRGNLARHRLTGTSPLVLRRVDGRQSPHDACMERACRMVYDRCRIESGRAQDNRLPPGRESVEEVGVAG